MLLNIYIYINKYILQAFCDGFKKALSKYKRTITTRFHIHLLKELLKAYNIRQEDFSRKLKFHYPEFQVICLQSLRTQRMRLRLVHPSSATFCTRCVREQNGYRKLHASLSCPSDARLRFQACLL